MCSPEKFVHTRHLYGDAVANPESLLGMASNERVQILIELVMVVWNVRDADKSLDKEINQLDREAVTPDADDDGIERLAQVLLHQEHLFPFKQLALRLVRLAL